MTANHRTIRRGLPVLLAAGLLPSAAHGIPAFPGAEGPGATATGGRGGDVYHVTRLDFDLSGTIPGTLTYGINTAPPEGRTIVFDVGGTIYQNGGGPNYWFRSSRSNITIAGQGSIHLGNRSLDLIHAPGHTPDGLAVYIREEKVLFAGDAVMPIPYLPHGDPEQFIQTMRRLKKLNPDHLVQGHGRPLLRGEVNEVLDQNIAYIKQAQKRVQALVEKGSPPEALANISLESCGMSRMPLGGLVEQLHRANLRFLYERFRQGAAPQEEV